MAIQAATTEGGGTTKNTPAASVALAAKNLKKAQANYDADIKNKQPAFVIAASKAVLDEAKKGYALSQPLRNDLIAADPGVKSAQAIVTAAKAEVAATKTSIATAKSDLAATKAAFAPTPTPTGPEVKQPGKAWTWDGKAWVKPNMPKDGKSYTWDDNNGWTLGTTAQVVEGKDVIPASPGEAYVWNPATKTWDRPPKPEGPGYSWDANDGWFVTTINPGSTGSPVGSEKVLAIDTFKNTFALMFGAKEAGQSYVNKLYELTSGFYKTGSTQEEAMNLAIRQAYNENAIPEFTKRFSGIFALDAKLRAGEAISVPTIAEFFAAEAKMGSTLTEAGLGELATQEFLGDVIGRGKSVLEVTNLISDAFNTIDNAPQALKDTLKRYYPAADRVSLAKAMLMGPEGAAALQKKIAGISVLSAAETQGITTDLTQASDIAAMGYTYNQSLVGFGEVKGLQRAGELAQVGGTNFTQQQAQNAVFSKNAADLTEIERLKQLEENRFSAKSGNIGSKAFASKDRGMN